jgi:hypothetical protein
MKIVTERGRHTTHKRKIRSVADHSFLFSLFLVGSIGITDVRAE